LALSFCNRQSLRCVMSVSHTPPSPLTDGRVDIDCRGRIGRWVFQTHSKELAVVDIGLRKDSLYRCSMLEHGRPFTSHNRGIGRTQRVGKADSDLFAIERTVSNHSDLED